MTTPVNEPERRVDPFRVATLIDKWCPRAYAADSQAARAIRALLEMDDRLAAYVPRGTGVDDPALPVGYESAFADGFKAQRIGMGRDAYAAVSDAWVGPWLAGFDLAAREARAAQSVITPEERAARDSGLYHAITEAGNFDGICYVLWTYVDPDFAADQEPVDVTLVRTVPVGQNGSGDRADIIIDAGSAVSLRIGGVTRASLARVGEAIIQYVQRMSEF